MSKHHIELATGSAKPVPTKNPIVWLISRCCWLWFKGNGWTLQGDWPDIDKMVLIGAPHTSNWDAVHLLAASGYYRVRLRWMGKQSLTSGPFGWFLKWLGCIPINRSGKNNTVQQMCKAFSSQKKFVLALSPEGTRTRTTEWKSGFYHIAHQAGVPILITVLDYERKIVRLSGTLIPSGDYAADMQHIKTHYRDIYGRHNDGFENS